VDGNEGAADSAVAILGYDAAYFGIDLETQPGNCRAACLQVWVAESALQECCRINGCVGGEWASRNLFDFGYL